MADLEQSDEMERLDPNHPEEAAAAIVFAG
jgi:hypothetical protein